MLKHEQHILLACTSSVSLCHCDFLCLSVHDRFFICVCKSQQYLHFIPRLQKAEKREGKWPNLKAYSRLGKWNGKDLLRNSLHDFLHSLKQAGLLLNTEAPGVYILQGMDDRERTCNDRGSCIHSDTHPYKPNPLHTALIWLICPPPPNGFQYFKSYSRTLVAVASSNLFPPMHGESCLSDA